MAKLHGLVYIAIGFFVSSVSWKISYEKLFLFFYAGLLFILFGIGKLIFSPKTNKEEKQKTADTKIQHKAPYQTTRQMQQFKCCFKCGNVARINDNFCSRCGARV